MSKVTVGCRLPTGIILRLADDQGNEKQVELKGQNADMNGAIFIQPTHCGYTEVDKDFWDAWVAKHADSPSVATGAIFAEATESKARGAAKERVKEKTGLEGAVAEDSGLKKVEE